MKFTSDNYQLVISFFKLIYKDDSFATLKKPHFCKNNVYCQMCVFDFER